jgi:hypothetical protein
MSVLFALFSISLRHVWARVLRIRVSRPTGIAMPGTYLFLMVIWASKVFSSMLFRLARCDLEAMFGGFEAGEYLAIPQHLGSFSFFGTVNSFVVITSLPYYLLDDVAVFVL